jgi:hypothetical protein
MTSLKSYYKYNFNSIMLSKSIILKLKDLPKIEKMVFCFIIDLSQYKKNLLLFYILINLLFGGV